MPESNAASDVNREPGADRTRRIGARACWWAIVVTLSAAAIIGTQASPRQSGQEGGSPSTDAPALADARLLFYNARYEAAAAMTRTLRESDAADLASHELRSSALLFQLKALLEDRRKDDALKHCTTCPALIADFLAEFRSGQALARAALQTNPGDLTALFFLGKLDLNYVWLQLGPLKKKTGWDEYWEARRSLDAVLKQDPRHVRARIARAWIDYVVDTKMPWGTRWVLGGGSKKQALIAMREAARIPSDFFTHAEAEFALWNLHVRERDMAAATEVARRLASDFPDNREVAAFLDARVASKSR
jgi:tetratricopeptide (TPR) repeat protein